MKLFNVTIIIVFTISSVIMEWSPYIIQFNRKQTQLRVYIRRAVCKSLGKRDREREKKCLISIRTSGATIIDFPLHNRIQIGNYSNKSILRRVLCSVHSFVQNSASSFPEINQKPWWLQIEIRADIKGEPRKMQTRTLAVCQHQ